MPSRWIHTHPALSRKWSIVSLANAGHGEIRNGRAARPGRAVAAPRPAIPRQRVPQRFIQPPRCSPARASCHGRRHVQHLRGLAHAPRKRPRSRVPGRSASAPARRRSHTGARFAPRRTYKRAHALGRVRPCARTPRSCLIGRSAQPQRHLAPRLHAVHVHGRAAVFLLHARWPARPRPEWNRPRCSRAWPPRGPFWGPPRRTSACRRPHGRSRPASHSVTRQPSCSSAATAFCTAGCS